MTPFFVASLTFSYPFPSLAPLLTYASLHSDTAVEAGDSNTDEANTAADVEAGANDIQVIIFHIIFLKVEMHTIDISKTN